MDILKEHTNEKKTLTRQEITDKIQNKYRWRIVIKGKVTKNLIEAINYALNKIKNPTDMTISVDINPNSMM